MVMMIMTVRVTNKIFISPDAYDCSVYIPWKSHTPTSLTSLEHPVMYCLLDCIIYHPLHVD